MVTTVKCSYLRPTECMVLEARITSEEGGGVGIRRHGSWALDKLCFLAQAVLTWLVHFVRNH